MKSSIRHTKMQERESSLGPGWPPDTTAYTRTSQDLTEPPLVFGRPVIASPGCSLCALAAELEGRGFSPEASAWAERDLILSFVFDEPPEDTVASFQKMYGLDLRPEDFEGHGALHVPALGAAPLGSIAALDSDGFDNRSWRETFDGLHLAVRYLRVGLATGELKPTVAEGIQATKLLTELMVVVPSEDQKEPSPLFLMVEVFRQVNERIEEEISDPASKAAIFRLIRETGEGLIERIQQGERMEPAFPRGRDGDTVDEEDEDEMERGSAR